MTVIDKTGGGPRASHRDLTPALIPPPPPPTLSRVEEDLRRKLLWMSWLRVATLIVLLGATMVLTSGVNLGYMRVVRDILVWIGLMGLIPATLQFPAVYATHSRRGLTAVAIIQIAQDCLFSAAIVTSTGGTGSAFTFFFSLTIVIAGILLGRMGTVVAIALSSAMMGLIAIFEQGLIEAPAPFREVLTSSSGYSLVYSLGLNAIAFVGIGFLSSYLSDQIRRADMQRERYRVNLEDLRQLHEAILASVEVGIITCRLDGRVLHVNRAAEDLLGFRLWQVKGKDLVTVFPEAGTIRDMGRREIEFERTAPGGVTIYLHMTPIPLLSAAGEMIGRILVVADVTRVKQMETRMKADERLTTVGKLSSMVAHEIRNPLAAISASAQMLAMSECLRGDDRHVLDIVVRETDRLNRWISDLLDYARPRKGEVATVDLRHLVAEVVDVVRGDPGSAGIKIMTRVDPDLSVRGDPTRLHRVFLNLAKNAIEAINGGGTIEVVATVDPGDDGQWVTVKVSDDGSGIPADDIDKVFEPFYTTKARGTGLGLAVVAQIVEEHGGAVSVRSMPDVGTEFTVRLRRV